MAVSFSRSLSTCSATEINFDSTGTESDYHLRNDAAVKVVCNCKSFRTRTNLADCVEQRWWVVLDFALLQRSSVSKWARASTRASKVGKGLSRNGGARKLALQHWHEAIDPRHRYGHNLAFYYQQWRSSDSKQPFLYWLDVGEGKELNLIDKCPRSKLQQQCIKYLGPVERKAYEIEFQGGKLVYSQTGELLHTAERGGTEGSESKWIFVLSTSNTLYVGKKKKGSFQHSSFLAGGAALAAGRIVAEKGILKAVWPYSGHYRPTKENFNDFLSFLSQRGVDLSDVRVDASDEEEGGGAHSKNTSF